MWALVAAFSLLLATAFPAAARSRPAVCAAADCPFDGAPQRLTFGTPAETAATAGPAGRSAGGPARRSARLQVVLSGVPRGRRAIVVVTAPDGRRWRTSRSRTFKPRQLGRWTIAGAPLATARGTVFPKYASTVVRIRRGGRGTVRVPYVQVVADSTRVAPEGAVSAVSVSGGVHTVVIRDPRNAVAVGTTLAAGRSKATPQGLLLTVSSVERSGETATITGVQAPLSAIGPQARITVKPKLSLGRGALGGARASAVGPRARAAVQEGTFAQPYKCSSGVRASVRGTMGLEAGSEIGISWGGYLHPLTIKAIAAATVRQSSELTLTVAGKAKCELDVNLLPEDISYTPITFSVGPVPVVITPKLNFRVFAEGSVQGTLSAQARQSLDARVGLEWDGSRLIPIKTLDSRFSFTAPRPDLNATIAGGIGPKLLFDVYDVGGPYLTADGFIRLDVSSTRDPWWRLAGGFRAGAGIKFKVWRFEFDRDKPDLFSKDWTIAQASGAKPPEPVDVTTDRLAGATVGTAYSATLAASDGTRPYRWSVTKGSLPAGLSLNASSGVVSGTPTTSGTAIFTVTVTDSKAKTASRELRMEVAAAALSIGPASLPAGRVRAGYRAELSGTGSIRPYQWSIADGALPAGLSIDGSTGVISGAPTAPGQSSFTVLLRGRDGQQASRAYTIEVTSDALSITTSSLPGATVGAPYGATVLAAGGVAPLSWAVTAGALPDGLAFATDGTFSGSATTAGTATFTVTATDAVGTQASQQLTIVSAYPALSVGEQPQLVSPMAGVPYSGTLSATGGGAPVTWAVTAGALPDGLSLATDGTISGTATTAGSVTFTVTATDRFGQRSQRELAMTVVPAALEVLTRTLPNAISGEDYSAELRARGGRAPYTWSADAMPVGLRLGRDGTVSGRLTGNGRQTFTVEVLDADALRASGTVSLSAVTPQPLRAVSCPTDTFCAASDFDGGVVTWDGSGWSDRVQVSRETSALGADTRALSCATATDCLMVDSTGRTYVMSNGSWSDGPETLPRGLTGMYDTMLSCATTSFCVLAGTTGDTRRAALWEWDGSRWADPVVPGSSSLTMSSVQCLARDNCVATLNSSGWIVRRNGPTWGSPTFTSSPSQMACTPTGKCVIGRDSGGWAFYDGTAWSAERRRPTPPSNPDDRGSGAVRPVTCARTGEFCIFDGIGPDRGLRSLRSWDGSASEAVVTLEATSSIWAASCSSPSLCVVVGSNGTARRWDGTTWHEEGVVAHS